MIHVTCFAKTGKYEIRISPDLRKWAETNSNDRNFNDQNLNTEVPVRSVLNFGYSNFDIVSDFGFCVSNLEDQLNPKQKTYIIAVG